MLSKFSWLAPNYIHLFEIDIRELMSFSCEQSYQSPKWLSYFQISWDSFYLDFYIWKAHCWDWMITILAILPVSEKRKIHISGRHQVQTCHSNFRRLETILETEFPGLKIVYWEPIKSLQNKQSPELEAAWWDRKRNRHEFNLSTFYAWIGHPAQPPFIFLSTNRRRQYPLLTFIALFWRIK